MVGLASRVSLHDNEPRSAVSTGLASAAVELLEHQVTTVRRILADPVQRYLLADEVGLGKTIEAGILIRQHVLDCPSTAKVLVVVPKHLVRQWQSELALKFYLKADGPVSVVSDDALRRQPPDAATISMLVVDEAHRSAEHAFHAGKEQHELYGRLSALAQRVPHVLLLSGTPVLHQEDGFLAMLHLIDPVGYPLGDRVAFQQRVRDRQAIAELTADLTDDASPLFVEEAVKRLEAVFGDHEGRLVELRDRVRRHMDSDRSDPERIAALRALRIHLIETYRLHRRLLRTRRDDPRVRDHLPRRTGVVRIDYEDQQRAEAFDFIDAWRSACPVGGGGHHEEAIELLVAFWVESALTLVCFCVPLRRDSPSAPVTGQERYPRGRQPFSAFLGLFLGARTTP